MLLQWIALATALAALVLGIAAVLMARSQEWRKAFRNLSGEIDDELQAQNRAIGKARDEFAELADAATKRYRKAARAAAELARRDAPDDPEPEPDDVSRDDEETRPGPRLHSLPAHVVADGRFGLGRSG